VTDGLAGQLLDLIDLGNPAWMHERRDPHTGEWIRTPGDELLGFAAPGPAGSVKRYTVPDPKRLFTKSGYRNPADHPFWRGNPVTPENVIAAYDAADEGTKMQGRRWYRQVHDIAKYIGEGDAEKGGILLSTYSPKNVWPANMFNAAESVRRGKPIGPGEGSFVTNAMADKAQRAMDGEGIDVLMSTAKTHSFGALIKNGDDVPEDPYGHVVIDTHAVNVAAGGVIRGDKMEKAPIGDVRQHEYVADQYRKAAKMISEREGELMKPHELQAITWLVQQRANQAMDDWNAKHGTKGEQARAKGRATMTRNWWKRWNAYADQHNIPLEKGVSGLANQLAAMFGDYEDSLTAQLLDLAAWEGEPRDPKGRWTRGGLAGQLASREREYQATKVGQGRPDYPVIGPEHARGNSRAVSRDEFQALAAKGNSWIDRAKRDSSPIAGLDEHWDEIKDRSYAEARKSWGGETIDTHTGRPLPQGADLYAISVKPRGMTTVSVPETATRDEFGAAMDRARELFRPALERKSFYLGVFHDDETHRIDIDPVAIVDSPELVEQVGSYTRAVGGAYHFKTGDGYWPPHVAEGAQMAGEDRVHFEGPGQWHTQAVAVQDPEPEDEDAE